MDSIVGTARQIVDDLRAAGIRATVDPREAAGSVPVVLVVPAPELRFDTLDGCSADAIYSIVAIGPGPGGLETTERLTGLVAAVSQTIAVSEAVPDAYQLGGNTEVYPAYLMRLEATVSLESETTDD